MIKGFSLDVKDIFDFIYYFWDHGHCWRLVEGLLEGSRSLMKGEPGLVVGYCASAHAV